MVEEEITEEMTNGLNDKLESESTPFLTPLGPFLIAKAALVGINDVLFDWVLGPLDLSGGWLIAEFIANLIIQFLILFLDFIVSGFSLSATFGDWKQIACLILEFIPGLGEIGPFSAFREIIRFFEKKKIIRKKRE